MPKILENVREELIKEAKKEVMESGYSLLTIRSVAAACHIAPGTVYNYFKSKDALVAAFMIEDWNEKVSKIKTECECAADPLSAIIYMYDGIKEFSSAYGALFNDAEAQKSYSSAFNLRHGMLIKQLTDILEVFCKKYAKEYTKALSEFIAESMLLWCVDRKQKEDFCAVVKQFF